MENKDKFKFRDNTKHLHLTLDENKSDKNAPSSIIDNDLFNDSEFTTVTMKDAKREEARLKKDNKVKRNAGPLATAFLWIATILVTIIFVAIPVLTILYCILLNDGFDMKQAWAPIVATVGAGVLLMVIFGYFSRKMWEWSLSNSKKDGTKRTRKGIWAILLSVFIVLGAAGVVVGGVYTHQTNGIWNKIKDEEKDWTNNNNVVEGKTAGDLLELANGKKADLNANNLEKIVVTYNINSKLVGADKLENDSINGGQLINKKITITIHSFSHYVDDVKTTYSYSKTSDDKYIITVTIKGDWKHQLIGIYNEHLEIKAQ